MDTLNYSNSSLNQAVNVTTDKKNWITPEVIIINSDIQTGNAVGAHEGTGVGNGSYVS